MDSHINWLTRSYVVLWARTSIGWLGLKQVMMLMIMMFIFWYFTVSLDPIKYFMSYCVYDNNIFPEILNEGASIISIILNQNAYLYTHALSYALYIPVFFHFSVCVDKLFFPRPLIFEFQQKVLELSDMCVSLSSPKIDLETDFSTWKVEVLRTSVFIIKEIFDIALLINAFISSNDLRNTY